MVQLASFVLSVFFCGNVYVGDAASEHCPSEALAGQEATTGDSMLMKTGHLTKSLVWSSATLEGFVPSGRPAVLGMGASPEQVVLLDATLGGLSVNHGNMLTAAVFRMAESATRWLVCAKESPYLKIVELVLEESDGKIVVKADVAKYKRMADMCNAQTANEVADSGNPTRVATSNTQGYGYGVVDLRYLPIQACADGGLNDAPVIRIPHGGHEIKMSCFDLGPKGFMSKAYGMDLCTVQGPYQARVKNKCKHTCGC